MTRLVFFGCMNSPFSSNSLVHEFANKLRFPCSDLLHAMWFRSGPIACKVQVV